MGPRSLALSAVIMVVAAACSSAASESGSYVARGGTRSAAPAAGKAPSARVVEVMGSLESRIYARVRMSFENPESKPCRIVRYTVRWATGEKTVEPKDFVVPAGGTVDRTLHIDTIDALTPAGTTVDVKADCS